MPLNVRDMDWDRASPLVEREIEDIRVSAGRANEKLDAVRVAIAEAHHKIDRINWQVSMIAAAAGMVGSWLLPKIGDLLSSGTAHAAEMLAGR